ncbi:nucleoid occlusion protein [Bacillaceae bacterium SIJ1]|uniref:nucleoid occlusion protein n=1 Tax=Litoribacterium kuwaitense TaxID=1398745 RepID=UPI0013EDE3FE|nr:nucleoid occlusion protein [Litoribacterium kuwaitense]NGP45204.1 nucleoid occlusion protein [Litoribacterium kuwaitense]
MKHPFSRLFGLGDKASDDVEMEEPSQEEVRQLSVENIVPNRFQPRTVFVDERIEELSQTIHTHGIIQPIVVREYEQNQYEIIAGERRFRAVKKLGWSEIPAIIKNFDDKQTASVALIENLQREELSSIEEANAYQRLLDLHDLTQEALAQRLGKGQSTIANKLRLLKLPEPVQNAILHKKISERHARAMIALKDEELQLQLLQEIIEKQLNVKQTEEWIQKRQEGEKKKAPKPRKKAYSRDMRIAMNTIRESLDMVSKNGLDIDTNEEEFDEYYQFVIKIPKNDVGPSFQSL